MNKKRTNVRFRLSIQCTEITPDDGLGWLRKAL